MKRLIALCSTLVLVTLVLEIPTNDPRMPSLEFSLFAHAWIGVKASPQSQSFGRLRPGATVEKLVQLISPDGEPFRLGHVDGDSSGLSILSESGDALPVHRLRVTYFAGERLGHIRGSVRITTDRPDAPFLDVPIGGEVVGAVSVSPRMIEIDRNQIGTVVKRTIFIRAEDAGTEIVLKEISVSEPWVLVTQKSKPFGRGQVALELSMRFPADRVARPGEILISIESPTNENYVIPLAVRGWIAPLTNDGE